MTAQRVSGMWMGSRAARVAWVFAAVGAAASSGAAQTPGQAQPSPAAPQQTAVGAPLVTVNPSRATLQKMQRRVSIELREQRLEDVIRFIQEFTGAELEPVWATGQSVGLDPEQQVTLNIQNLTALEALEKILAKAQTDFQENTWQMTEYGAMQIGPKEALNRERRTVIYDINDLLMVIPDYPNVPEIDLGAVLQQAGQGGGSGGNIFEEDDDDEVEKKTRAERAQDIVNLITQIVEPEQWRDNGGEGGSITYYNGTLIVRAPDYMHRQIVGYPYWPNSTARNVNGRRYVTLGVDAGIGTVDGFAEQPVTGVVPGGGGGSPPPP